MQSTIFVLLGLIASVAQAKIGNTRDPSTYGNIDEAYATHIDLDFAVDFDREVFEGQVVHTMKMVEPHVASVFFDAEGLNISKAEFILNHGGSGEYQNVEFKVTRPNEKLGDAIEVMLPSQSALPPGIEFRIRMTYVTNNKTTAISWLKPSQTAGGQLPYLFTQCEDIACRSVAPMQDTPAIKITYGAVVKVKNEFKVFMSANSTDKAYWNSTHTAYKFENAIKMPSYLIAIAVGDLEYKSLGNRTGVITEPSKMEAVSTELASVPDLLDRAEKYLTNYIWGNYSILVLPPSFPMGGMENPLLTFASPTIITGDKSQVYVATHEIAHSWTGNEVTCENWSNFWLNEGFTVFEERKVSAEIHGKDFSLVNAYLGNISMFNAMETFGLDHSYSSLYPIIKTDAPDNSFSEVPYEKGFQFLFYLETLLGEEHMQGLIRKHILAYSQQSVTWDQFQDVFFLYLQDNFSMDDRTAIYEQIDWRAWIHSPGLAPVHLDFVTPELLEAQSLADQYIAGGGHSTPENYTEYNSWYSSLKVIFLEKLVTADSAMVTVELLQKIDTDLNITGTLDPECKQRWYPLGITKNYTAVKEPAHTFISSQGRMKYLTPIYTALLQSGQRELAIAWYNENVDFYHPYAVEQLKRLLGINAQEQQPAFKEKKEKLTWSDYIHKMMHKLLPFKVGPFAFDVFKTMN